MDTCARLATTGADQFPFLFVAIALIITGAATLLILRRRTKAWIGLFSIVIILSGGIALASPTTALAVDCEQPVPPISSATPTPTPTPTPSATVVAPLTAVADTAAIVEDATPNTTSGNVLTNDSSLAGYTLSVANAGTYSLTYGTLVLNANGTFVYTLDNGNPVVNALNTGQRLTDTFTYTASDGHGGTASAVLAVTINGTTDNRAPALAPDTASVTEDTPPNPISGNVLSNDGDPDGNTLSVTNGGTSTLSYGVLVLHADGTYAYTLDNSNPAVTALDNGEFLTDQFVYSVSDGHGGISSSTLTITIHGVTNTP